MDTRPIGMFDSGVGGLTVYKEIRKKFSNEDIIYLGDTKSFPYGSKSKESIINLTKNGIDFLISKNVKAIIIACGTATSQALDVVKKLYNIPIIGIIEPTAKYIAKNSNIKNVGIVATHGTIRSNGWQNALLKYNPNLHIINRACPLLAPMAEEGWTDNRVAELAVAEYMKGLNNVDALVLGCTHYPLFTNIFKMNLKTSAEIINTGTIIANSLISTLGKNLLNSKNNTGITQIYLTDTECNFISVAKNLLNVPSLVVNKADMTDIKIDISESSSINA